MSQSNDYTDSTANTLPSDDEVFDPKNPPGPKAEKSTRKKLYIYVKQSGSDKKFGVSIRGSDTIADLKAEITKLEGFKSFALQDGDGNYFDDEDTVDQSDIEDRDTIIMELN